MRRTHPTGSAVMTTTAYRRGEEFSLERPGPDWEEIHVELAPDVKVARSGMGELRIYLEFQPFGLSLKAALEQRWCWIVANSE